jgi:FdhD protein
MAGGSGAPDDSSRTDAVRELPVRRWRGDSCVDTTDLIAAEVPVSLRYNSIPHVVLMCTPQDLEDLGYGFTVSEALVADRGELRGVELRVEDGAPTLGISVAGTRLAEILERRRNLTGRSGCGVCGAEVVEDVIRHPPPVSDGGHTSRARLVAALRLLAARQPLGARTGSLHAAAWVSWEGEIGLVREDVGRHNALDKLIGARLRQGADFSDGYALITSRASYEMVQKAATLGIRMLVAVSAPTSLAVQLARECNMTLVGFAREEQQVIYAHPGRLGD